MALWKGRGEPGGRASREGAGDGCGTEAKLAIRLPQSPSWPQPFPLTQSSRHLHRPSLCMGLMKTRDPPSLWAVGGDLSLQTQMCTAHYKMLFVIKYIIKCHFN